jgi:ComF family protein
VGTWFCDTCLARVSYVRPPFCALCGDRVDRATLCRRCQADPLRIDGIRSVCYFEGSVRKAVHGLKYEGIRALEEPLGGLLADYWRTHELTFDVIAPVPLHQARLRQRGYNQAGLLAQELARRVECAYEPDALIRHRATVSQVDLDAHERRENVRDAFRCAVDVSDRRVLLIDDVCTTGSTLEACATPLYEAGADCVWALTLARAL